MALAQDGRLLRLSIPKNRTGPQPVVPLPGWPDAQGLHQIDLQMTKVPVVPCQGEMTLIGRPIRTRRTGGLCIFLHITQQDTRHR